MTEPTAWRPISMEESRVIQAIVSAAGIHRATHSSRTSPAHSSPTRHLAFSTSESALPAGVPTCLMARFPQGHSCQVPPPAMARSSSGSPRGTSPGSNTRGQAKNRPQGGRCRTRCKLHIDDLPADGLLDDHKSHAARPTRRTRCRVEPRASRRAPRPHAVHPLRHAPPTTQATRRRPGIRDRAAHHPPPIR
jgi:hypothetical protein